MEQVNRSLDEGTKNGNEGLRGNKWRSESLDVWSLEIRWSRKA